MHQAPDSGALSLYRSERRPTASLKLNWRPPQREHRKQIREIVTATGVFRAEEVEIALEVFDDYCAAPGRDYYALGAFRGDELAGFAFYGPTPGTVGTWDLYWIAVRPELQRSGTGKGLLERVEEHLRSLGCRLCVIETSSRADYAPTRRFYTACGYEAVARIPDFYDEADDRVIYTKGLSESASPAGAAGDEE